MKSVRFNEFGNPAEVLRAMATNEIVPPVEAEYPLTDVLTVVAHAERPGRSGKVLLVG